jgi:dCMP deaminase
MNALVSSPEPVKGYTLYTWPFLTCERCAVHMIQAGIKMVVAPLGLDKGRDARWHEDHENARDHYAVAQVVCKELKL